MQFKDSGKKKAITFSFDDGVSQDVRMVQLLDKYGLKATFHISSNRLGRYGLVTYSGHKITRYALAEKHLTDAYAGHEVASHTLDHVLLPDCKSDEEIIRQVEQDRLRLSEIMGYEIVGLAYPGDPAGRKNYDERCVELIQKNTGIQYARSVGYNRSFALPQNLYAIETQYPLCRFEERDQAADKFLNSTADTPQALLYMCHCYEMDYGSEYWYKTEEFFERISKRDDIFYGTMKEIYL